MRCVVSCEHATAHVPAAYRSAFRGAGEALASHRGSDIGALVLARQLARMLRVPCLAATATRLLVDANRSRHHPKVFSEWSRQLDERLRDRIVAAHWTPHRDAVQAAIARHTRRGHTVLHVSVHSFTPVFDGIERPIDVAWLYDPRRAGELDIVRAWRAALAERAPDLRLRRNAPYRGRSDGLTTAMRRQFDGERYLGIELEVSQRFPLGAAADWRALRAGICASLADALRI